MKRFYIYADGSGAECRAETLGHGHNFDVQESVGGDWVRADEALAEIANARLADSDASGTQALKAEIAKLRAVVDALPRCTGLWVDGKRVDCNRLAIVSGPLHRQFGCEEHASQFGNDLPYADALRALEMKFTCDE